MNETDSPVRPRGPAYRIDTPRLVLRCYNPADAPLVKAAVDENVEHLKPWMPWAKDEPQELDAKIDLLRRFRSNFDAGKEFVYGVFNREESQVWGGAGLHLRAGADALEIGYWIHKDHLNQGLATEATAALTKVAFRVEQVDRVEIRCDPQNVRSSAVPRKLGFIHEATLRRRDRTPKGERKDTMIWTLFADQFPDDFASDVPIEAFDAIGRKILS